MKLSRAMWFVVPVLVLTVVRAASHHAFSPVYDSKRTITVEGVVTEFRFVNPHAMMLMDVKDKTGKVETWNVEFAGRLNLEEAGWSAQSIKPGEHVKVTGNPMPAVAPLLEAPLPASIPLLLGAIVMLGILGWRSRSSA